MIPVEQLAETGIPVLVDGAQSAGATPLDVDALGCTFYTVSGQKWLLGPDGTGALYVDPERLAELDVAFPSYFSQQSYEDSGAFVPTEGAARLDNGTVPHRRSADWSSRSRLPKKPALGDSTMHARSPSAAGSPRGARRCGDRARPVDARLLPPERRGARDGRATCLARRRGSRAAAPRLGAGIGRVLDERRRCRSSRRGRLRAGQEGDPQFCGAPVYRPASSPSSSAIGRSAAMTNAMCSSRSTPSSSAPR